MRFSLIIAIIAITICVNLNGKLLLLNSFLLSSFSVVIFPLKTVKARGHQKYLDQYKALGPKKLVGTHDKLRRLLLVKRASYGSHQHHGRGHSTHRKRKSIVKVKIHHPRGSKRNHRRRHHGKDHKQRKHHRGHHKRNRSASRGPNTVTFRPFRNRRFGQ